MLDETERSTLHYLFLINDDVFTLPKKDYTSVEEKMCGGKK